jgi:hypothetical protein
MHAGNNMGIMTSLKNLLQKGGRGGERPSSHRERPQPAAPGRVVTNDEAADSPSQTAQRARGTTVRTATATRCQA